MTFEHRLADAARLTEQQLERWIGGLALPPHHGDVRSRTPRPERLEQAMRHAVFGGGKRFRPFLVLESSGLFDVDPAAAAAVAAALECVHCYSLAHDDLPAMDDDRLRRGRPTVWAAYDKWTAILAGDALLTLAFEILADPASHIPPVTANVLIRRLAIAAGRSGMVGGQMLDLEAGKLGSPAKPGLAHVRRLQAMKTGALIAYAAVAGAILGERPLADETALRAFGDAVGLAFQISDDLLDAEGDSAQVGKAVAKDAGANKATIVSLTGIAAAKAELAKTVARAVSALEPFGTRADGLREAARFMLDRRA